MSRRFHSRYNAVSKTYRYTLWHAPYKPVFDRKYVTVMENKPDVQAMREAAAHITGTHDFKSFCGNPHMKKSTVRNYTRGRSVHKDRLLRRRLFAEHGAYNDGYIAGGRYGQNEGG